jgi:DNA invertase Pin-like site-specific DNA recombinase
MKTKYFLYARKSTEDEERQIMSIEAQLVELEEYAKREKLEIVERFIESKSAKKPGREIFNEMLTKVNESKEPLGLLAWHPDRGCVVTS